jgi:nucleoside-diphosphate-sugar epimerase
VEDAARAYVLALEHGKAGNVYNITSSNDATVRWASRACMLEEY